MTEVEKRVEEYINCTFIPHPSGARWFTDYEMKEMAIEIAQQETELLSKHILELQADKGNLIDELTKKADTNHSLVEQMAKQNEQLEQAKEIIEKLMYTPRSCLAWYCLCDKAKQFIKENKND